MYWRHELAHTHHGDCYLQMTLLCVHSAESSVEVEEELEKLTRVPSCNYLFKKTITNSRFIQLLGLNHISRMKMRERCDKQDYTWME